MSNRFKALSVETAKLVVTVPTAGVRVAAHGIQDVTSRLARALGCMLMLTWLLAFPSHAAVVLHVSGGQLAGASGVMVKGVSYDVTFVDGSCVALFSGCNEAGDFMFKTQVDAVAASAALLEQVLLDGPLGNFDTRPQDTVGCSYVYVCSALTPYSRELDSVGVGMASNFTFPFFLSDEAGWSTQDAGLDVTSVPHFVYAVWAESAVPSAVPEPSTSMLLAMAGIVLGWSQRRRGLLCRARR